MPGLNSLVFLILSPWELFAAACFAGYAQQRGRRLAAEADQSHVDHTAWLLRDEITLLQSYPRDVTKADVPYRTWIKILEAREACKHHAVLY